MDRKVNEKVFSLSNLLLFVFFLLSVSSPTHEYVRAQSNIDSLSHINENANVYDFTRVSSKRVMTSGAKSQRYMLIPGGDAIGIKIQTDGLVVVDTYAVTTTHGDVNPAREAGIMKGDVIVAVNNEKVSTLEDYKQHLVHNQENHVLTITISRQGKTTDFTIQPVTSTDGDVTTGLYLRDKLAGIGTLTYIDPVTNKYGALGHEIIDQDTNQLVTINEGEIINSNVTSIRKATNGKPGEKIADILFDEKLGTLEKNNHFGIYGMMKSQKFSNKDLIPIAYVEEVKKGPAQILTVLSGTKVELFNIEIIEVNAQTQKAVKGLKYVVTDTRLLEETGGIVQGMSGSPIIQDGKIIGAVTHVLVHDSTLGYGIFIEWMLQESEIDYMKVNTTHQVA